tara:strand:+ start:39 stop:449 length:411 start_codon:yes stop_codon:yes gene_type:complete
VLSPSITKDQTIIIAGDTVQGFGCQHWIVLSVYAGVASIKAVHLGDYPVNFIMSVSYDVLQNKCTFINRPEGAKFKVGDTVEAFKGQQWAVVSLLNDGVTLSAVAGGDYHSNYQHGFEIDVSYKSLVLFGKKVASS